MAVDRLFVTSSSTVKSCCSSLLPLMDLASSRTVPAEPAGPRPSWTYCQLLQVLCVRVTDMRSRDRGLCWLQSGTRGMSRRSWSRSQIAQNCSSLGLRRFWSKPLGRCQWPDARSSWKGRAWRRCSSGRNANRGSAGSRWLTSYCRSQTYHSLLRSSRLHRLSSGYICSKGYQLSTLLSSF